MPLILSLFLLKEAKIPFITQFLSIKIKFLNYEIVQMKNKRNSFKQRLLKDLK